MKNSLGMKRVLKAVSIAALPFVAGCQLILSPYAAAVGTIPAVNYSMTGSCLSGNPCTARMTIERNPSSYYVRAYEYCHSTGKELYGSWYQSGTSSTGSCGSRDYAIISGFQYSKSHHYSKHCWSVGHGSLVGVCTY